MHELKSSIGVIGAGIQGVCISLCLIKKGFKVTLIDRDEPGKESMLLMVMLVIFLHMLPCQLIGQICL